MTTPTIRSSDGPDKPRRTLLVVTYFFPPTGGVGVQRTLQFVRNLRLEGWRAVVVTPAEPAYPVRDPELLAEVPEDVSIIRTANLEPAGFAGGLASRFRQRVDKRDSSASAPQVHAAGRTGSEAAASRRREPLRAFLRTGRQWWMRLLRIVLFPDDQVLWWLFAVRAVRRSKERSAIDAIYSSSPPFTTHLIARAARGTLGRPWVADFRDPFVGNAFAGRPSALKGRLQAWLEGHIVDTAEAIVVASPSMERAFRTRYPKAASRIVCIPNGYDRSDFERIAPLPRRAGLFTIVYGGSIYGTRELGLFLDGVEHLLARRPELRERLRIEFVGRVNVLNQGIAASYASPARLGRIVSYTGFLPRREALGRMRSADALLQLISDDPGKEAFVGTKTLESLGFDLPILAVVPRGDARALLEELDWGVIADPEPEAIAMGLEQLIDSPRPVRMADPERRYDRATQARQLAALLDGLVRKRGESGGSGWRQPPSNRP